MFSPDRGPWTSKPRSEATTLFAPYPPVPRRKGVHHDSVDATDIVHAIEFVATEKANGVPCSFVVTWEEVKVAGSRSVIRDGEDSLPISLWRRLRDILDASEAFLQRAEGPDPQEADGQGLSDALPQQPLKLAGITLFGTVRGHRERKTVEEDVGRESHGPSATEGPSIPKIVVYDIEVHRSCVFCCCPGVDEADQGGFHGDVKLATEDHVLGREFLDFDSSAVLCQGAGLPFPQPIARGSFELCCRTAEGEVDLDRSMEESPPSPISDLPDIWPGFAEPRPPRPSVSSSTPALEVVDAIFEPQSLSPRSMSPPSTCFSKEGGDVAFADGNVLMCTAPNQRAATSPPHHAAGWDEVNKSPHSRRPDETVTSTHHGGVTTMVVRPAWVPADKRFHVDRTRLMVEIDSRRVGTGDREQEFAGSISPASSKSRRRQSRRRAKNHPLNLLRLEVCQRLGGEAGLKRFLPQDASGPPLSPRGRSKRSRGRRAGTAQEVAVRAIEKVVAAPLKLDSGLVGRLIAMPSPTRSVRRREKGVRNTLPRDPFKASHPENKPLVESTKVRLAIVEEVARRSKSMVAAEAKRSRHPE